MAYGKEYKEEVLSRFHASGMSMRAACSSLEGFPCAATLSAFAREEGAGLLRPPALAVPGRCEGRRAWEPYPLGTKREAMRLLAGGMEPRFVAGRLGIASAAPVRLWASRLGRLDGLDGRSRPDGERERGEAVTMFARGSSVSEIAGRIGADRRIVRRWLDKAGVERKRATKGKGGEGVAKEEGGERGEWSRAWGDLPEGDPVERARLAEVRLAEALAVLDVLKAPGPGSLSNSEKRRAGERARAMAARARVDDVLRDFRIARSTYFSQAAMAARPDRHAALRARVRAAFEGSKGRYGSLSVWAALRRGEGAPVRARDLAPGDMEAPVVDSQQVGRRSMREEGPVPDQVKERRRHSSYAGETDERPANLPLREDGTHGFRADAPGRLVVTDVTEFDLGGLKVYLSPIIDCFDGCPVAWRMSTRPDDELTAGSLEDALGRLEEGCAVHTDGGGNYRSARWKGVCEANGLVRSMSRKAKSPDNARAEGFFGTLKQEFFYARDWKGTTKGSFVRALDEYIVWYRDEKIKRSLGWKTIAAHRAALAAAA